MSKVAVDIENQLSKAYKRLEDLRALLHQAIVLQAEVDQPFSNHMSVAIRNLRASINDAQGVVDNLLSQLKEVIACQGRQLKLKIPE
jgi:hypothetical protein